MVISNAPTQLTTLAVAVERTKYFPIELYCTNMVPSTPYDVYLNGQLVNEFCKPFGGNLGDPLLSDISGKLRAQYMYSVQYKQSYLVNPDIDSKIVTKTMTLTLVDPFNRSSTVSIPITLKAGA